MKKRNLQKKYSLTPSTSQLSNRVREGCFILILGMSLFLLIALLTYHQSDPGWSHVPTSKSIKNATGAVGAWIADLFLYLFGYMAYLFPLLFVTSSWGWIRESSQDSDDDEEEKASNYWILGFRFLGCLLVIAAGCGLANLELPSISNELPFTTGGVIGQVVSTGLVTILNLPGTTLILLATVLAGATILGKLSWLKVIEKTGYFTLLTFDYVCGLLKRSDDRLEEEDEEELEEDEEDDDDFDEEDEDEDEDDDFDEEDDEEELDEDERREPALKISLFQKLRQKDKRSITIYDRIEPRLMQGAIANKITKTTPASSSAASAANGKKNAVTKTSRSIDISRASGPLPSLNLLDAPTKSTQLGYSNEALEEMSYNVEQRLLDFGIEAQVVAVHPGPVITRFELQLAPGIKVSKISALVKDLARSLSVISVRIVEVIPGKSVIGLEVPNEHREIVRLREVLASQQYSQAKSPLSLALGKDIAGHPVIVDLAKMPHLLVAGTTGSGKSVGLNVMLLSLLYKATPEEVKLILIDPKMLELSVYDGIPHLLTPVVTDMKEAASALKWCVAEMERRYKLMASFGVRNVFGFNAKLQEAKDKGEELYDPLYTQSDIPEDEIPPLEPLPYIVVLVDEFADMMMVVGKKVEELIARIAQKARAAGIHLILATQRPSVDVITGLIKANIPTRIAFQVSSRIDSRTILDQQGAEQLLGQGDMLYLPPGTGVPVRVHGAFVDDHEVHRVVKDWLKRGTPTYIDTITTYVDSGESGANGGEDAGETDPLYDEAVRIVTETRKASISGIQRRLRIGYNRAARILEDMEAAGIVSPMEGNGAREVIAPPPV